MNGSISPQIIIASATVNGVNNNTANVSADTLHDLDTGTVLFIKTSTGAGLAAQTANNVRDSIEFQIGVSNNKDVTGLNAKLLPPIKVSNISAFKRIAYAAPVKQMTIVGATIGDAIDNGGTITKDKYYICIASGTMVTAGGATLSQVWSPSGATFVNVPDAGVGAAVVAGNIYLATANGTVGAAGAANLFAELATETTLGSSLATGSEAGIYIQDDSNLATQGKHEPGDIRWYTELKTVKNTQYNMLDNIVTKINNSNPVARAIRLGNTTEATIDTEIIVLGSKVAGDKFTVKSTYEYLHATVTDQILASKGQGTYAQMVELVKLAGYNYGGGTGSYELQNQYFPAYANEVAKLGASSTTFSQYHIRCSTDRTNPFGIKQQVSNLDYFIIVPNNSGVNDNTHTHITAIQAAINTALGL